MAFRFSLEALLKYREALERRELLALERTQQEVIAAESEVRKTEKQRSDTVETRQTQLSVGMKANELRALVEAELQLEQRKEEQVRALKELVIKREQRMGAYRESRRKRDLLEKLRSRKLADYTREQAQAEQERMDDLYLARRKRER